MRTVTSSELSVYELAKPHTAGDRLHGVAVGYRNTAIKLLFTVLTQWVILPKCQSRANFHPILARANAARIRSPFHPQHDNLRRMHPNISGVRCVSTESIDLTPLESNISTGNTWFLLLLIPPPSVRHKFFRWSFST